MSSETELISRWLTLILYQPLLRWTNLAALVVLYYTYKVLYRLYFSPLSHIPGRKLAGMLFTLQFSSQGITPSQNLPSPSIQVSYPCEQPLTGSS